MSIYCQRLESPALKRAVRDQQNQILASQTLHPSIEKPMLDGQAEPPFDRHPSCVAGGNMARRPGGLHRLGNDGQL